MLKPSRTILWTLALAAGLLFPQSARTQDRPIVIHGGSPLTIEQQDLSVPALKSGPKRLALKPVGKRTLASQFPENVVTEVTVDAEHGGVQTFKFDNEQCDVRLRFGTLRVAVQTDPEGRNLRVVLLGRKPIGSLFGSTRKQLVIRHFEPDDKIHDIQIWKAGEPQTVGPASGHLTITIHNEEKPVTKE